MLSTEGKHIGNRLNLEPNAMIKIQCRSVFLVIINLGLGQFISLMIARERDKIIMIVKVKVIILVKV